MRASFDDRWIWSNRYSSLGLSLTFVEGGDEGGVLRAFGADPGEAEVLSLDECGEEFGYELPVIRVGEVGGWRFAFELFGRSGSQEDVVVALSRGSRVVQVLRTGSAVSVFRYAVGGQMVCSLDPLMPQSRSGSDPDRLLDAMRTVGLDPDRPDDELDALTAMLRLVSEVFGIVLEAGIVEGPLLSAEQSVDMSWLDADNEV
ncbi:hypothetical protein ACWT_3416 [Actinoplanes sp. SE50]|uniref:DUF6461 domain-containing protein n=1 Tax=unclassified Actinoplanes TaxID=2626549 RepID=UPI0005BAB79E|nr:MULTISPECIES: DUF6461 domain-containing protein [unclassified Actinoplanes]ATO82831.1 hypothetical protein ACWT_3416 [Actinoplanes sp. SE50]